MRESLAAGARRVRVRAPSAHNTRFLAGGSRSPAAKGQGTGAAFAPDGRSPRSPLIGDSLFVT